MDRSAELYDHISAVIRASGPLTIARFMAEVLNHPTLGYYANRNPIGKMGDFITAPEISQMYGELISAWLIDCWEKLGKPDPVSLVELGPGRGTFIADFWRVAQMVPEFSDAVRIYLLEGSPVLRKQQKQRFEMLGCGDKTIWVTEFKEIPDIPFLLFANEFFDALPVHQFVNVNGKWRERLVDVDPNGHKELCYVVAPHTTTMPLLKYASEAAGKTMEMSPAGILLTETISEKLCRVRGAALIVDFGLASPSLSLQAEMSHSTCDPLMNLGLADMSSAVDFGALRRAAVRGGARVYGPVSQGKLLRSLGIEQRSSQLVMSLDHVEARLVIQSKERLTDVAFMGQLFQSIAITSRNLPHVAGFDSP